jgi:RHS repeat-associated protein
MKLRSRGSAVLIKVTWGTATSNWNPNSTLNPGTGSGGSSICPALPADTVSQSVVTAITLPNGEQYTFSYNSTYGMLDKITYPSGGYIQYTWGVNPQSASEFYSTEVSKTEYFCSYIYDKPVILNRYVSYDGTNVALEQDFSYTPVTWTSSGTGGLVTWTSPKTTTVTTYDKARGTSYPGFQTVYNYSSLQGPYVPIIGANLIANPQIPVEQTVQYYGTNGSLLRTSTKGWLDTYELACELDTLDTGQIAGKFYTYGQGGSVTSVSEYDYGLFTSTSSCTNGAGAPSSPTPTRETVTTYQSFADTPIFPSTTSIFDRPSTVKVYLNGTSGTLESETDYTYDQTALGSPTATQHDGTNYPASLMAPRGNATTIVRKCLQSAPACSSGNPTTTFTYDDTGQALSTTDANGNKTSYSYTDSFTSGTPPENTNAYLTQLTMPQTGSVSHIENYSYSYADGQLTQSKDQNSQITTYKYGTTPSGCSYTDGLDRMTEVDYPDGGKTTHCYNDTPPKPTITTTKNLTTSQTIVSTATMDGVGHVTQTALTSDPDGTDYTVATYDGLGHSYQSYNLTRCSTPTTNCGESTWGFTTSVYDALGRITIFVPQDGTVPTGSTCPSNDVCTSYSGNTTTVTDEAGISRESTTDGLGRLTQVTENPGGLGYVTGYSYDALDDLTNVLQNGSRPRTFAYNSLAQLTSSTNPESSYSSSTETTVPTTYVYDANGNLTSKTTPAQNQTGTSTVTLSYCYDALNRMTSKAYTNQSCPMTSPVATYAYDGATPSGCSIGTFSYGSVIGRRSAMCDAAGSEAWSYDVMGRVLTDQRTTNSIAKSTTYVYLPYVDGSINTVTYPSGRVFTFTTGAADRLTSVVDSSVNYATAAHYTPGGALAGILNGTNLSSTFIYNSRLQPCWIYATTGSALAKSTACTATDPGPANILDLQYNFSLGTADNGNVNGITNNRDTTRSQNFYYDALNRLLTAETTSTQSNSIANCWGESYIYDNAPSGSGAWGNLMEINVASSSYNRCTQENLSTTVSAQNRLNSVGYDTAGNSISYGSSTYTYNAENQLTQAAAPSAVGYVYDGDGKRVEKTSGGTPYKLYWYDPSGNVLDETDQTGVITNSNFSEYVFFGGKRIARRDSAGDVFYYSADHLGTSREIVQAGQTSPCYESDFYPFGGERTPIVDTCVWNNYKFTSKERDSESDLDNLGARNYSSTLGRFMRPDDPNLDQDPDDPQSWTLYGYVRNNPLNNLDPSGNACVSTDGGSSYHDDDSGGQTCKQADPKNNTKPSAIVCGSFWCTNFTAKDLIALDDLLSYNDRHEMYRAEIPIDRAGVELVEELPNLVRLAKFSDILRLARLGKGNFGLGEATAQEAAELGKAWVGDGATVASDGKTLVSADKLRQYRPPELKPSIGKTQANFEARQQPFGQWQSNGHLDIK